LPQGILRYFSKISVEELSRFLKKNYFLKKFGREKNRPERDSTEAYRLIRKIKIFAFSLLTVKNNLVLTKKKYVLES